MNLQEYETTGRKKYQEFLKLTLQRLQTIIDKSNSQLKHPPLTTQARVKTIESLKNKVSRYHRFNNEEIQNLVNDLAGCRIIFYYNSDINIFRNFLYAGHYFLIKNVKPHYPITETDNLYMAYHIIIQLKENDPEYEEFKEMKCEIQLQHILGHAWSETNHDILYKSINPGGFGKQIWDNLNENSKELMNKYIKPAIFQLELIRTHHDSLIACKKFLDTKELDELGHNVDNNIRWERLDRFKKYVLPYFNDVITASEISIKAVSNTLNAENIKQYWPIKTPYGNLPGKKYEDIVELCIEILLSPNVFYINIKLVFNNIIEIYVSNPELHKQIERLVIPAVSYRISVWRKLQGHIQLVILETIFKWNELTLLAAKPLVIHICIKLLANDINDAYMSNYKAVAFQRGTIPPTDDIRHIRKQALNILENLYQQAFTVAEKKSILNAIFACTYLPGGGPQEVINMISDNTQQILNFIKQVIENENSLEIIEEIENKVYLQGYYHADSKNRILALEIEKKLNSHQEYSIYKTLVGFKGIFGPWEQQADDGHGTRFQKDMVEREQKAKEFAESISIKNYDKWRERIVKYAQTESNDLATFPIFAKFLQYFGEKTPDLALKFLETDAQRLPSFIHLPMLGIEASGRFTDLEALQEKWISNNLFLFQVALFYEYSSHCRLKILHQLQEHAKQLTDINTLCQLIITTAAKFSKDNPKEVISLFISTIKILSEHNNANWIYKYWIRKEYSNILAAINAEEVEIILNNLIVIESIDHKVETVLTEIAKFHSEKVLDYFKTRIEYRKAHKETLKNYDAIPYQLVDLKEQLSLIPDKAVDIVVNWYQSYGQFVTGGADLLSIIFPEMPEGFEHKLNKLVQIGSARNIEIVLAILSNYKGETFLDNLCKAIIKALPTDSTLLVEVEFILLQMDAVKGEYGLLELYQAKQTRINNWRNDENEKVRLFASNFYGELEKLIKSEKARTEEDIEIRKHLYGDDKQT